MEKKSQYMLLVLKERNGEYEYTHRCVHKLPDTREISMKRFSEKYLKDFYGGKIEKEDDGYYFHDGEVFVRVSTYQKISLEEYNVLNRFL